MLNIQNHFTKCMVAGIVALLPIGGLIITVGWLEVQMADAGLKKLPFYFPGFAVLVAVVLLYLVGLAVTTFIGKWLWTRIDRLLEKLPALGLLYRTLKQILGYGQGGDAIFREVVLVPGRNEKSEELGLVTNTVKGEDGKEKLLVFVPSSPTPTTGRLMFVDPEDAKRLKMPVSVMLKALVSVGKTEMSLDVME